MFVGAKLANFCQFLTKKHNFFIHRPKFHNSPTAAAPVFLPILPQINK